MADNKSLWRCGECGKVRAWGTVPPDKNDEYEPLLDCKGCEKPTRHGYLCFGLEPRQ